MAGEPLGDPFPWAPLLSPLNMVVGQVLLAQAGRAAAAACVLLAAGWALRGGAAGAGRKGVSGRPLSQVRPGCARTHPRPHSRPLRHNQFGRKGKGRARGRGAEPPNCQRRFGLVTPTARRQPAGHAQRGKQLGAGGTGLRTDRQTDRPLHGQTGGLRGSQTSSRGTRTPLGPPPSTPVSAPGAAEGAPEPTASPVPVPGSRPVAWGSDGVADGGASLWAFPPVEGQEGHLGRCLLRRWPPRLHEGSGPPFPGAHGTGPGPGVPSAVSVEGGVEGGHPGLALGRPGGPRGGRGTWRREQGPSRLERPGQA